jgi:hypothetical protein
MDDSPSLMFLSKFVLFVFKQRYFVYKSPISQAVLPSRPGATRDAGVLGG